MPDPAPPSEAAIATLARDASPAECWAALETFVARWYGRTLHEAPPPANGVGPPLVRRLGALARQVPELFHQNELVRLDKLAVKDGRVVFLLENQEVCVWATEPEGDNARVWYHNNHPSEPWLEEPVRLPWFLIQTVLFEAVIGAPFGASITTRSRALVDQVLGRVDPLGDTKWHWSGARFYGRDNALVVTHEHSGGEQWDIFIGARAPSALIRFRDLVTKDWSRADLT